MACSKPRQSKRLSIAPTFVGTPMVWHFYLAVGRQRIVRRYRRLIKDYLWIASCLLLRLRHMNIAELKYRSY